MSNRARLLLQALVTLLAVAAIGGALLWATRVPETASASADRIDELTAAGDTSSAGRPGTTAEVATAGATGVAEPTDSPVPEPTPTPTPTPLPTPTPIPEPEPFVELLDRDDLADVFTSPLPDCSLTSGVTTSEGSAIETLTGTVIVRCIENWAATGVVAAAPGRIVHISSKPAPPELLSDIVLTGEAPELAGVFSWRTQGALGPHVVVDHGAVAGASSVQTVYAGLATIDLTLGVGQLVEQGQVLGALDGPHPELRFGLWVDNVRQDGAEAVVEGPDEETQRRVARALAPLLVSPTDPECPLSLGSTQLPNATRGYRNGTHQGIDFGCGTSDRFGYAVADGTVVYLIDDYRDPTVLEREALLQNAAIAGLTPHWTLVMLYGNVVVIDHDEIPGAGRLYTIAAHLEQIDAGIQLGGEVEQGQLLGELGNRGTNASAEGRRGAQDPSLHLHWELFVDNWYLGSGQTPAVVEELVVTALCGAAATPGCPVTE